VVVAACAGSSGDFLPSSPPTERTRLGRVETFERDQVEVSLGEDRDEPGDWRVEYSDEGGDCFVTIFAGPAAEQRARAYFEALRSRHLKIICDDLN
jgi:hypothetical protein